LSHFLYSGRTTSSITALEMYISRQAKGPYAMQTFFARIKTVTHPALILVCLFRIIQKQNDTTEYLM
jgi:hypothetical protein